jgi:exonuclease III
MSTRFNIQTAGTADFSKIKIDGIKTNKYGGRSARINYDGGRFLLQTPRMRLPYGLGVYEEKDAEGRVTKTRYSLDFSFGGYKADERNSEKPLVKRFYEWVDKFETYVKEQAKKNSYTWVGEPDASEATIRALFRPIIKHHRDKTTGKITGLYPPTMKANVGFWDGRFTVDVYDQNR